MTLPSIKDVAQQAGVSIATVSHVLNKTKHVSEELRRRVLEAVDRLGYKSNPFAKNLKTSRSNIISVIVPNLENPLYTDFIAGVIHIAQEAQYAVLTFSCDDSAEKERELLSSPFMEYVCGVILFPLGTSNPEVRNLLKRSIPVVIGGQYLRGTGTKQILSDIKNGVKIATEYLLDSRKGNIGFIAQCDQVCSKDAFEGYQLALTRSKRHLQPELTRTEAGSGKGGYKAAYNLMTLMPPPEAIIIVDSLMALGIRKALNNTGLKTPEDITFCIVCSEEVARMNIEMVCIVPRSHEIGQLAVRELLKIMHSLSEPSNMREYLLPKIYAFGTEVLVNHSELKCIRGSDKKGDE